MSNTSAENKNTEEVLNDISKYLEKIAAQNNKKNIIIRGILQGFFTALGATIIFALFLYVFGEIARHTRLDEILEETGLGLLIDNIIDEKEGETSIPSYPEN